MKVLALIGALYFLALTAVPCSDFEQEVNHMEQSGDHHDHGNEADDCSPLCFCHCCHVHITVSSEQYVLQVGETIVDNYSSYLNYIPDSPIKSLLRPPRV